MTDINSCYHWPLAIIPIVSTTAVASTSTEMVRVAFLSLGYRSEIAFLYNLFNRSVAHIEYQCTSIHDLPVSNKETVQWFSI
jgi:hypothetical protein